jgi:hypothetical protein
LTSPDANPFSQSSGACSKVLVLHPPTYQFCKVSCTPPEQLLTDIYRYNEETRSSQGVSPSTCGFDGRFIYQFELGYGQSQGKGRSYHPFFYHFAALSL